MSCPCGAQWTGYGVAHCPACHLTFTSDSAFNRHLASQRTAGCLDPADVGLGGRVDAGR